MEIARLKSVIRRTTNDMEIAARLLIAEHHKRYPRQNKIQALESEVKKQKNRLAGLKAELQRKEETESA